MNLKPIITIDAKDWKGKTIKALSDSSTDPFPGFVLYRSRFSPAGSKIGDILSETKISSAIATFMPHLVNLYKPGSSIIPIDPGAYWNGFLEQ